MTAHRDTGRQVSKYITIDILTKATVDYLNAKAYRLKKTNAVTQEEVSEFIVSNLDTYKSIRKDYIDSWFNKNERPTIGQSNWNVEQYNKDNLKLMLFKELIQEHLN